MSFGEPIAVDEFIRQHPRLLANDFDERKPHLQALAEMIMTRISDALPVTPVALAAAAFAEQPMMSDAEVAAAIESRRDRVWLLREKTGLEVWHAARRILELRRLLRPAQRWRSNLFEGSGVPVVEDAWEWSPDELLLRDYYANSLLTFDEVQRRGWPAKHSAAL